MIFFLHPNLHKRKKRDFERKGESFMKKLPWWAWMPQMIISIVAIIIALNTLR